MFFMKFIKFTPNNNKPYKNKNFIYGVYYTLYVAEEILNHKHVEANGDIIEMRIWGVPISETNPEGIAYSLVYVRMGLRLVGYDNEWHGQPGSNPHKHIKDRIIP